MSYSPNSRGSSFKGSSRQLQTGYQNGTLSTMAKGTPVASNVSGQLILLDVSNETTVLSMVGLTSSEIPSAASGLVVSGGRLEDISLPYNVGDAIYVGKSATLTNIKPNVGSNGFVVGDFVIFVGVVVKNEFNLSQLDIQLMLSLVGQL